jgi:hypothetical protein
VWGPGRELPQTEVFEDFFYDVFGLDDRFRGQGKNDGGPFFQTGEKSVPLVMQFSESGVGEHMTITVF